MNQASVSSPTDVLSALQQLLSAARQGVILFNERGEIAYASPLAIQILEINEDNNGGRISAQITLQDGTAVPSLGHAHLQAPTLLMVKRSGETFEHIVKICAADQDGVLIQDVTEELRRDGGERAYLDIVAHDLRAGLVPLKTYAQMLHTGVLGPVTEKQGDALRSIDHCVERQVEKIGSVLDTIKAEENRLELTREPVNLADVIQKAVGMCERDCKRRNLQLTTTVTGSTVVDADVQRLQRVFSTLISRAVRAGMQDGHIGVELKHLGEFIRVRIWDNGAAMSCEDVGILQSSALKQAQDRVRENTKPNIDLAPIHDIIQRHGGRISARADESGTTCLVYLPACRKTATEAKSAPRRALIVSGDTREQSALKNSLAAEGFQVFSTASAADAQRCAREHFHPLLFISDTLENADIWKLQAAIREERPDEPHAACMLLREVEQPQRPTSDGSTWLLNAEKLDSGLQSVLPDMCQRAQVAPAAPSPGTAI
ncbi:MAG TPA: HAMP domain-containing sensor histidine kinase [Planctomycetota bacterium]|nr:HAMP domain-containing sensor histidine kinase [Planctomycetota bacterium]